MTTELAAVAISFPLIGSVIGLSTFFIKQQFKSRISAFDDARIVWNFWLQWILGNSAGLATGFTIGNTLDTVLSESVPELVGILLSWILIGLAVGIAQWIVLRRYVAYAHWWIIANILGWGVGGIIGLWVFGWPSAWILIGVVQWAALRKQVSQASWWILASPVAWIVGWVLGMLITEAIFDVPKVVLQTAAIGAITGIIGGGALVILLWFPVSATQ